MGLAEVVKRLEELLHTLAIYLDTHLPTSASGAGGGEGGEGEQQAMMMTNMIAMMNVACPPALSTVLLPRHSVTSSALSPTSVALASTAKRQSASGMPTTPLNTTTRVEDVSSSSSSSSTAVSASALPTRRDSSLSTTSSLGDAEGGEGAVIEKGEGTEDIGEEDNGRRNEEEGKEEGASLAPNAEAV